MDASAHFRGKKITVMGLGLLGRGLGDVQYLASCGAELIVTDRKSADELASSVAALSGFQDIEFVLGEHRLEDFRGRDMILKAAGVPIDSPYIAEARKEGTPIRMSADLFAELAGIPIIGVTGTRGKSTTTHMLNAILTHAGMKVLLGGNVQGVSTLGLLSEATPVHIGLFELDSWQLQGFGEAGISPHIAIFTTFYPDHMNYYPDMLTYLEDKANIFLNQYAEDILILGGQCAELIKEKYEGELLGTTIVADASNLPEDWKLAIPGMHNRYDAALALMAAHALGVSDEESKEALESFKGVAGRLELVRTVDGVEFYNDTTATTPDAAVAAFRALGDAEKKNILVIMGGADKGLDMSKMVEEAARFAKRIALLPGTGTERIRASFPDAEVYDNLAMAFADVFVHADAGDIVLLCPAFSSFGMFTNEYDRGDQFNALVQAL